jgi:hypothetical protein
VSGPRSKKQGVISSFKREGGQKPRLSPEYYSYRGSGSRLAEAHNNGGRICVSGRRGHETRRTHSPVLDANCLRIEEHGESARSGVID